MVGVTILILIDGFLQSNELVEKLPLTVVTILILIDGFLQSNQLIVNPDGTVSHNPYFNRWFSAIGSADLSPFYRTVTILILIDGFLQYDTHKLYYRAQRVTILILIDGFLQ